MTRLWDAPTAIEPLLARAFARWLAPLQASAASVPASGSALRRRLGWATPAGAAFAAFAVAAGSAFGDRPTLVGALVLVAMVAMVALLIHGFATQILGALDGEWSEREVLRTELRAARKTEQAFRTLAYHDELTGLPNRSLLYDRLDVAIRHARRQSTRLALLFLDLDDFKTVNDSFGHGFGDRLLVELARRLRGSVRAGDTVARFGGDEFVVLLEAVSGTADASQVATKVLEAIRTPFGLDGQHVTIAASLGMSLFPDDGVSCQELLGRADAAMYRDKQDVARRGQAMGSFGQELSGGDAASGGRCEEDDVLALGTRPHADRRAAKSLSALRSAGEAAALR